MSLSLFNADCLEIMKDISSNSIDLILCDLPFGCLSGRAIGKTAEDKKLFSGSALGCSWDIKIDLEKFWEQVKRIRKNDHTPTIHFCTTKYGFDLFNSNPDEFRYDLVWAKPNGVGFLSANKMPLRSHEMMYVFSKKGAFYNRVDISGNFKEWKQFGNPKSDGVYGLVNRKTSVIVEKGTITSSSDKRCIKSVIDCSNKKTKGGHPTSKPIELYKFLIERYCPVGGTVLDPTFGSGNSGKAAQLLNRKYIGIEKDKTFYDKALSILLPTPPKK